MEIDHNINMKVDKGVVSSENILVLEIGQLECWKPNSHFRIENNQFFF